MVSAALTDVPRSATQQVMDPRLAELKNDLEKLGILPVYLVCGEEALVVASAAQMIEEAALAGSSRDFNLDRYELSDVPVDTILGAVQTLPMMGGRRVVRVRCREGLDKAASDALVTYLANPSPTNTLLLVAAKVDLRLAIAGQIKHKKGLYSFTPLKAAQIPDVLVSGAKEIGWNLDKRAASMLVETVGTDLLTLQTTLEKLALYVGERRVITVADVEASVVRTKEEVIWEFIDAMAERQLSKALLILDGMLEHGQEPLMVVSMVARHFRQLWKVKSLLAEGCAPADVAKEAGVHPFVAQKLTQQAHRFPNKQLHSIHRAIFRTDVGLKSLRIAPRIQLENLLLEVCAR